MTDREIVAGALYGLECTLDLEERWDSPNNKPALDKAIKDILTALSQSPATVACRDCWKDEKMVEGNKYCDSCSGTGEVAIMLKRECERWSNCENGNCAFCSVVNDGYGTITRKMSQAELREWMGQARGRRIPILLSVFKYYELPDTFTDSEGIEWSVGI